MGNRPVHDFLPTYVKGPTTITKAIRSADLVAWISYPITLRRVLKNHRTRISIRTRMDTAGTNSQTQLPPGTIRREQHVVSLVPNRYVVVTTPPLSRIREHRVRRCMK